MDIPTWLNNKNHGRNGQNDPFWNRVNGDIELLAPFREFWFLRGGPLAQVFDGGRARIHNGEKLGEDDLEPWLVEICVKCRTEFI